MPEKPYHHGNLRNALIETGISLILSEGIDRLSLRRVAALCGVSQAAPYAHFDNKEALLRAMREYVTECFTRALHEAEQDVSDENDPRLLMEMGKRYVLFFLKNPHYFSFIFGQDWMHLDLDLHSEAKDAFPPYQLLKSNGERIFKHMGMTEQAIEDRLISMWATVHGLTSIATMQNVHYSKSWADKIEDILMSQA